MLQFVLNPTAGGGRALRALPELQALLVAKKIEHNISLTQAPGHATEIARALPKTNPVVVVGGDGTISETINGLWDGAKVWQTVGVLPLGTGDDFARGAGLSINQLAAALEIVLRGDTQEFDLGILNKQIFLNGFGSGFDAQVGRSVKRTPNFLPGPMRYLAAILAELSALQQRNVRVFVEDVCVYDGAALLVAVMNFTGYGGGLKIAPNAIGNDGVFDVVVGGKFSRMGALGILPRLQRGTHLSHSEVKVFRGADVRLEWMEDTAAHVDGELLNPAKIFEMKILPKSIKIFMPNQKA